MDNSGDSRALFVKTKMCKFDRKGMCTKGSACTFAHSPQELSAQPDLRCTKMCRDFLQRGQCLQPGCTFAHSRDELRSVKIKTPAHVEEFRKRQATLRERQSHGDQSKDTKDPRGIPPSARPPPPNCPPPAPPAELGLRPPPGLEAGDASLSSSSGSEDGPLYITSSASFWDTPFHGVPLYLPEVGTSYADASGAYF
eukprot:TRINITY_DN27693_c0_g1_i1.p1 TRINITY_DN27693_c0_g1~~TRINITY_DN27693_c0_g1_i1.p1  ORF type:complete len:197 (+),score=18.25 TRINITY_DN27693_c0_g1_i1:144-734(+)